MAKLPFMQFFPGDWVVDVQTISLKARGAWIDLLCQCWLSPDRGRLLWNRKQFTTFLRLEYDEEIEDMVAELSRVANIRLLNTEDQEVEHFAEATWVEIISRRMVRDEARRKGKQDADLRYNEKRTKQKRSTNDHETTPIYQKSEVRSQKKRRESQPSPEGRRSAQTLSDKIFENHPTRTAPTEAVLMDWSREADRIYKIDKHGWEEILSLIEWSQVDPFWKTNILSMSKFRKQWNQLTAHRTRGETHEQKGARGLESLKGWAGRLPKP